MTICQSHRFFRKYVDDFKRFVPPLGDEWGGGSHYQEYYYIESLGF